MKSVKVLQLADELQVRLGLVLYNSLFDLLHPDPNEQHKVFKRLVIQSLQDYAKYYPVVIERRHIQLDKFVKFYSNFDSYLQGKIDENHIQLVPRGIYYIKNLLGLNAQWWKYNTDTKELRIQPFIGLGHICYFADYPYVIDFAPDGKITEDSKVYYIDIDEDQNFLVFLSYTVLRFIRNVNTSVNLNLPVQFLSNIDQLISETQEQYNDLIETRYTMYRMWRK